MASRCARPQDMRNLVGLMRVGQQVVLDVIRNGQKGTVNATIQEIEQVSVGGEELSFRLAGSRIEQVRESDIRAGNVDYLRVSEVIPGTAAWNAGLREGDILTSINKVRINTIDEAVLAIKKSRSLLLNIQRGNQALYVLLK